MGFIAPDKWLLEDALVLVRELQPQTRRFDYHLTLGGGVLNRGQSDKDLDLYFLPLSKTDKCNNKGLVEWLNGLWGMPDRFWREPREITYERLQEAAVAYEAEHGAGVAYNRWDLAPYLQNEYKDMDHTLYGFKGKYLYGGLRVDVFVMGGEKLDGDEWFKKEENAPDFDPVPRPLQDPPPLMGGERNYARGVGEVREYLGGGEFARYVEAHENYEAEGALREAADPRQNPVEAPALNNNWWYQAALNPIMQAPQIQAENNINPDNNNRRPQVFLDLIRRLERRP